MKGQWQAICAAALVLLATAAAAQPESATDQTLSPYFLVDSDDPETDRFPLKDTQVQVRIDGVIAAVTVTQHYTNTGSRPINARYIFPASTRAAVNGMVMQIGEQRIVAQVKERQKAKQTFNAAKKAGKSASLLEQQRPNVFSMQVANILPGDEVVMELRYTELLVPTDAVYDFVYPTVVGPRYAGQAEAQAATERDRWVANPYLAEGRPNPSRFSLSLQMAAGMPIKALECPSHETDIHWESKSAARLTLKEVQGDNGNRDFILRYRLAGDAVETGLLLGKGADENFFLMMVQPPERVRPEQLPPREYIFVVDVSGSMNGFPLNTAKRLLKDLIGGLQSRDRFNLVLFAGGSKVMAPASLPATAANIEAATRLLDRQRGGGGTELKSAMQRALELPRDENGARTLLLVTDGYITAERPVFRLIADNLSGTSVFAFGIGTSVNRYLIEGIARAGMGEPFVVTHPREAADAAARFRDYVSAPVLTGVSVAAEGFETYDLEPPVMPDVYARRPLVVMGKWRGSPRGALRIRGTGGQGAFERTLPVTEKDVDETPGALPYLWARSRLSRISDFAVDLDASERDAEITSLGLTYNLLTRNTSFVAVHETVRLTEGQTSKTVNQPLPLPQHVSNLAVGGVAKVPEPGLTALAVAACLLMGGIYWNRRRRMTGGPVLSVRRDGR